MYTIPFSENKIKFKDSKDSNIDIFRGHLLSPRAFSPDVLPFQDCLHESSVTAQPLQSCPTLCDQVNCSPLSSSLHGILLGKNTGVGCHALLQGIFPTQGSNPRLLCLSPWQEGSLPLLPLHGSNTFQILFLQSVL